MSQQHKKDDPRMGRRYFIDGRLWEIVDIWRDIDSKDHVPWNVTLDEVDGDDFGLYMGAAEVDKLNQVEPEAATTH